MAIYFHHELLREETVFPLDGFLEGFERPVVDAFADEDLEVKEKRSRRLEAISVFLEIVDDAFGFPKAVAATADEQVEDVVFGDEGVKTMTRCSLLDGVGIGREKN